MFDTLRRRADDNAAALTSHTTNSSRRRAARAFTLIELIVVIVIIGILAGIAAVAYNQFVGHARDKAVLSSASDISEAVDTAAAQAGTSSAAVLTDPATTYADGTLTLAGGVTSRVTGGVLTTTGSGSFTITDGVSCAQIVGNTDSTAVSTASACDATPLAGAPAEVPMNVGGYASATGNENVGYQVTMPGLTPNTDYSAQCDGQEMLYAGLYSETVTSNSAGVALFTVPARKLFSTAGQTTMMGDPLPVGTPLGIQSGVWANCSFDINGGGWNITR